MGTDIHMAVEQKRDGSWHRVPLPESARNPDDVEYAARRRAEMGANDSHVLWAERRANQDWYGGRNYDLFAMLADVRNGVGFAGVVRGARREPIHAPKGLPDDLSSELRTPENKSALIECGIDASDIENENEEDYDNPDRFWLGYHDWSWLTLAELQAYDWQKGIPSCGYIKLEEWRERKAKGETVRPHEYSGGASGGKVICLEEGEAESLV